MSEFFGKVAVQKETLAQTFSCEYCKIFKNIFFIEHLRWLSLVKLEPSLWNKQNFSYFWLYLISWALSTLWHNSCKTQYLHKNKNKNILQWNVPNRRSFSAFTEWVVLWNCFLNDLIVKNKYLFNFYKKKIMR